MTGKLDQSLDTILAARKKAAGRPRRVPRRAATGAKPVAAPVGGVKKAVKPVKRNEKVSPPTGPTRGDSKIMVSNLPSDVKEPQIKEYFQQSIAPVKKVILAYGPNGVSRGSATVIFSKSDAATKAAKELGGVKVDGKPMRIDVLVEGKGTLEVAETKKLSDRISQPKNASKSKPQPKSAVEAKGNKQPEKKGANPSRGGRGKRPGARPKKTAEDLDAEMADYFTQSNQENAAPNAAAADTNMGGDI